MPWQEDRHERTEKASPRRRQEARDRGQVARSKEAVSVAVLMTGVGVFYFFGQAMVESLGVIMSGFLSGSSSFDMTRQGLHSALTRTLKDVSYPFLPLLLFPAAGIAANMAQVGLLVTAEPLMPKFSRINPLEGIKRVISLASLAELVKGVAKLALVGYMAYISIKAETGSFARLTDMEAAGILVSIGSSSFRILLKTSGVLVALAALDYGFQRWELEKSLSMTRHEVKEEFKETEGQPLIKSRVRSLQRQLAKKRMMQDVPKATAVITNPTHLAVALRYEHGSMRAPVVVAKGAGLVAERIKDIARTSGVPLIENRPLAQALWKTVEIGKEIPASLFKAVAEVLAYVYRLRVRR